MSRIDEESDFAPTHALFQRRRGYTVNDPLPSILNTPPELVPTPFRVPDYKITDLEWAGALNFKLRTTQWFTCGVI